VEAIVNFTFWPVDGPGHCRQAFEDDPQAVFNDDNGDVFRFLLKIVIVLTCIPISVVLYLVWVIRKVFGMDAGAAAG